MRKLANGNVAHGCEMCDGEDECTCRPTHLTALQVNRDQRETVEMTNEEAEAHELYRAGILSNPSAASEGTRVKANIKPSGDGIADYPGSDDGEANCEFTFDKYGNLTSVRLI